MSRNDPLIQIATLLVSSTESRNINWRTTDDPEAFLFSGSGASVITSHWMDRDQDDDCYSLTVLNSGGTEVAELRSTWIPVPVDPSADPWVAQGYTPGPNNRLLADLHEAARRNALHIDRVIDSLIQDLS